MKYDTLYDLVKKKSFFIILDILAHYKNEYPSGIVIGYKNFNFAVKHLSYSKAWDRTKGVLVRWGILELIKTKGKTTGIKITEKGEKLIDHLDLLQDFLFPGIKTKSFFDILEDMIENVKDK